MIKKALLFALSTIFCIHAGLLADVDSTREVLNQHSQYNPAVQKMYDEFVISWEAYNELNKRNWDFDKLLLAVEYSAKKHEGQIRKDAAKTPYIIHPIGVARIAWEIGGVRSTNVLIAALLHDTLEDTNATVEEIESLFGPRIAQTVVELTNDPDLDSQSNKQRQVEHAPQMSHDAQLVKLADRIYNVTDLKDSPPPSWTKAKRDNYWGWAVALRESLTGTNCAMEEHLDRLALDYEKSREID